MSKGVLRIAVAVAVIVVRRDWSWGDHRRWMRLGLGWSLSLAAALGKAGTVALLTLGLVEEAGDQPHQTPPAQRSSSARTRRWEYASAAYCGVRCA